jgi:hypothetical protein
MRVVEQQEQPPERPRASRLERANEFLKSGTGLVVAVTALVVAVGGLVTGVARLTGEEDGAAESGSPAAAAGEGGTTASGLSPSQQELLLHVPAAIRPTCGQPVGPEEGAAAAINCRYREHVGLQYNLFASTRELRDAFADVKSRYGLDGGLDGASCEAGRFEGEHRADGQVVGHVVCFVDEPGEVAAIVWTREDLDVLTFAWRDDMDLPALEEAWQRGVGPDA